MKLQRPVSEKWPISLGYGVYPMWLRILLNKRNHDGIDYACPVGTEVINPFVDGKGTRVVYHGEEPSGWGKYIVLRNVTGNNNIFFAVFAHLSRIIRPVGGLVRANETVALSGKSGFCKGAHTHYGLYGAIDPNKFL